MQLLNSMPANQNPAMLGGGKPMIIHNQNINHIDKQTLNLTVNYKAPSNDSQLAGSRGVKSSSKQRASSSHNYKVSIDSNS